MALPIEAELAKPPIFTPEQEQHILHSPTGDLADDPDLHGPTSEGPSNHATTASSGVRVTGASGDVGAGSGGEQRLIAGFNAHDW